MRRSSIALIVLAVAISTSASTLTFRVPAHEVNIRQANGSQVLRVLLAGEQLQARVTVDVYSIASVPASKRHLKELRAMPKKSWWKEISWTVRDASGQAVPISPKMVRNRVNDNSSAGADWRERPANLKTYDALFDLGRFAPGDYTIETSIRGLSSSKLAVSVRRGDEAELRGHEKELRGKRK